jgi:tRNA A-37 threonylcarbamoyl transferase component Bud32
MNAIFNSPNNPFSLRKAKELFKDCLGIQKPRVSFLAGGVDGRVFKVSPLRAVKMMKIEQRGAARRSNLVTEEELIHEINQARRMNRFLRAKPTSLFCVPNVYKCAILHTTEGSHFAFILMDFVQGTTLWDYYLSKKTLNGRRAVGVLFGRVVGWLHAHGIVHGDIHTKNVLVVGNGRTSPSRMKLAVLDWAWSHQKGEPRYLDYQWNDARQYDLIQSAVATDHAYTSGFVEGYNSTAGPTLRINERLIAMLAKLSGEYFNAVTLQRYNVKSRSITRSSSRSRSSTRRSRLSSTSFS